MNIKSAKKMIGVTKAKAIFFGFVFILMFSFFWANSVKVSAVTVASGVKVEILNTMFDKNEDETLDSATETFGVATMHKGEDTDNTLTFIQGNGGQIGVKFRLTGFPSTTKAFVIMESDYSDSSSSADMDKYKKDTDGNWCVEVTGEDGKVTCESQTTTKNLIAGKAEFAADGTTVEIVYRLRKGEYGLKYFKIFFFTGEVSTTSPYSETTVVYVISKPIDMVEIGAACKDVDNEGICDDQADKIYTDYINGSFTRLSKKLNIYIPKSVAFNFNVVGLTYTYNSVLDVNIVNNYSDVIDGSSIYAINYFYENGNVVSPEVPASANRSYLYTEFTSYGVDSQAKTNDYITGVTGSKNYTYYLNMMANELDYIETLVDATGKYHYYLKDVFGNTNVITQDVTDVKNRAIIVEMQKSNAALGGYDAVETFTNESVKVELTMTVETHFEYGVCVDDEKCTQITKLDKTNVRTIKYWRVDIDKDDDNVDEDAYVNGMAATVEYASRNYAYDGIVYDLFCGTGATGCDASSNAYNPANKNNDNGHGSDLDEFNGNVFVMYVANSGRYRFYIEDTYGNDTEGTADGRVEGEYRNPRVEVYAIDKAAPDISFEEHTTNQTVGEDTLIAFDIETCKYYQALELISTSVNCGGVYEYDGTTDETELASITPINGMIYYPINRDNGRTGDVSFTDAMAILLSKVKVSDKQYYYGGASVTFADYSDYGRDSGSKYVVYEVANDITTILKNTKHNSSGLKSGSSFSFLEINYYHHDGVKANTVCSQVQALGGDFTSYTDEMNCVNYYIDHGVDFIIEFKAEDSVGNVGTNRVYVNMVDTTPAGFTLHYKEGTTEIDNTKLVRSSNIGTDCRMEIGQEIGKGTNQTILQILNCYKVDLSVAATGAGYNFEDNVYGGLEFANSINDVSHVKLFMKSDPNADGETSWLNLGNGEDGQTFIPNKTGYYDMKIVICDAAGNELSVIVSYYVDRKIVLIEPLLNSKAYGSADPTFDYCVYIDEDNDNINRYKENPYLTPSYFENIYCTNQDADDVEDGKKILFQQNTNSDFYGALSRLESSWYNLEKEFTVLGRDDVGVENNYVGLYRIILGTLNIKLKSDGATQDDDYIVKIHPSSRDDTKYNPTGDETENDNLITNRILEDDDEFSQSNVDFTIRQILLGVNASGGVKKYGQKDAGYEDFDNDSANSYLNGFDEDNVEGLIYDGLQYVDDVSIVLGVLRREVGENVGAYAVCNYRGDSLDDDDTEDVNDVYVGCSTIISPLLTLGFDQTYQNSDYDEGILKLGSSYISSRALYIKSNKEADGKTLNTTDKERDNNHANYVIVYTGANYVIESIDLVVQAAPGQRREYTFAGVSDPNPWEIILYGLVDGDIKRAESGFNGYTETMLVDTGEADDDASDEDNVLKDGKYYETARANDSSAVAQLGANLSESRTNWYLYHNNVQLKGYKTNESYYLLRSTAASSSEGSAKLIRESGNFGGWYLYYGLDTDLNVVSGSNSAIKSDMAVITNGRNQCSYDADATGHLVTVGGGESLCKNYNLVYNPYYTDASGYTVETKPEGTLPVDGYYQSYVYKSNAQSCLTLDPDIPCTNTESDDKKVYKIHFEIYRRELIIEFNSALETIETNAADGTISKWNIFYGKRYEYYQNNLFDFTSTEMAPEGYLFLCYKNESNMAAADLSNGGCTSDGSYGLTAGDTWSNVGIYFKMHDNVSATYNDADDKAIPAGAYYIYSDINQEQKRNYNYKYKGGTLTIKSLPVKVVITSYAKEYGEKYYSLYGSGSEYDSFKSLDQCLLDGWFLNGTSTLISLGTDEGGNVIYCTGSDISADNQEIVTYGFDIEGMDSLDDIISNFTGRAIRDRSVTSEADVNGLQENVGTYKLKRGTITTKLNNPYYAIGSTNVCATQVLKNANGGISSYGNCVVKTGKSLDNYVVEGTNLSYSFDLVGEANPVESQITITIPATDEGYLYITPAELKITVDANQTKMYGCAYNVYNTSGSYTYSYASGYATNCIETDGNYYDLGYSYTVSGDKDYQIAKNGFDYESSDSYPISGIYGSTTFRETIENYKGLKQYALNNGTLYRIPWTEYFNGEGETTNGIKMSAYVDAAINAQKTSGKTYQGQTVGKYVITLGNVDATDNEAKSTYTNACDVNNMPDLNGKFVCKNYNINYYGTSVVESKNVDGVTTEESAQTYKNDDNEFPTELTFTITKRKAYVYTNYAQKIYGEADMYSTTNPISASYLCGDYNMDGAVNDDDNVTLEGGTIVNKDVYYGFCSQEQVTNNKGVDATKYTIVDYGLNRYYTKYNSLAKAPWNGLGTRNDVQTDVVSGRLSRKGMSGNAPTTDDFRGYYEYVYDNATYYGTVKLTSGYGAVNYDVNFYNAGGLAVNENGETTMTHDGETVDIKYEIVLRQIKVAFVSFSKVYGEQDDVADYNILVCAPSEEFDFVNMKCTGKDEGDKHGLSTSHLNTYVVDGKLVQSNFKHDFIVKFMRVLGENVSCGTSSDVIVNLSGYFYGTDAEVFSDGEVYKTTLSCMNVNIGEDTKKVYETLGYITQSEGTLGYNYQINYTTGYVNITPRPILVTPDADQGFMYGDYDDTLIPAISFTDRVLTDDNIKQSYGLVHGEGEEGVCLNNINYYNKVTTTDTDRINKANGTCFNINDRKDEYESNLNTSILNESDAVNSNTGLANLSKKYYVFGDVYTTDEPANGRSALDRELGTVTSARYNRNVGRYVINMGDLKDNSGNYDLSFEDGVTYYYTITAADITVTPDDDDLAGNTSGTSHKGQYKIYGEKDKELTFTVKTTYTVTTTHYAKHNQNIVSVCTDGTCKKLSELARYNYSNGSFSTNVEGTHIYLNAGDVVTLDGFAYDENNGSSNHLDYGKSQSGKKNGAEDDTVNQGNVKESIYFDKACSGVSISVGCNTNDDNLKELSYGATSRILLGYLYVDGYNQAAGVYDIKNGLKVAVNEFNQKNYDLKPMTTVSFTIIPRPIGVQIENIEKTYGQTTDIISCDSGVDCSVESGILMSDNNYLKYNFNTSFFSGADKLESIIKDYDVGGTTYDNSTLYSQNGTYATGLASNATYSAYNVAESKDDKHLGVYVSRDEKNTASADCMFNGDKFGFCEDVGTYYLRFYGYLNTIDSITKDNYATATGYKPTTADYTGLTSSVSEFYYNSYFGYNPNYFVVVIDNNESENVIIPDNLFAGTVTSTSRVAASEGSYAHDNLLVATGKLVIKKKNVALYVNTSFFEEGKEIYYVGQNTRAPELPIINEEYNLLYNTFYGINAATGVANPDNADRETAVHGINTYGRIIWGSKPNQVRTGDKLTGELAYCNKLITETAYNTLLTSGLTSDYGCDDLEYEVNNVNTNLIGYIPIVRDSDVLSITNKDAESANASYETNNYTTVFYPGALRVEKDDTKPVVSVNRTDVYIEANAVGKYLYECVGSNSSTTYSNCTVNGTTYSIYGKKEASDTNDPILSWLNTSANSSLIIKGELPLVDNCDGSEIACTSSAYFQTTYGKGKESFASNGGIVSGTEANHVTPFTLEDKDAIDSESPDSLKEMINTLISWFGVTAYDQGEIRIDPITGNEQVLEKTFNKYWYLIIEEEGNNGNFAINRVGKYTVHFYVMDNAGNVSEGNMYDIEKDGEGNVISSTLQTRYGNIGTLHIVDTTKPNVGTVNLYNGLVVCDAQDCTIEDNWKVAEDTYVPLNTLLKYDSEGTFTVNGTHVDIGGSGLEAISTLTKYSRTSGMGGYIYSEDASQGRYIKIPEGNNARALKHYGWSNSSKGIYLTITGGSDNSYSEVAFPDREAVDKSQWNHYYSRDGGITWIFYDRTNKGGSTAYVALNAEGSREILIKAVDKGVHITSASESTVTYTVKYYGESYTCSNAEGCTATMNKYTFADTSLNDEWLDAFASIVLEDLSEEERAAYETQRHTAVDNLGWNVSDAASEDTATSETISQMLYGLPAAGEGQTISGYKYYKDKATAYLDRTAPVIGFGTANGNSMYVYEFGCATCTSTYTEKYAGAIDSYPTSSTSNEIAATFDKNYSILLNHHLYESTKDEENTKYQPSYANVSQEQPSKSSLNSGLGGDYAMEGTNAGTDIRDINAYERRYVIYAFNESTGARTGVYELSDKIPTSTTSTDGESNIYNIIKQELSWYQTNGDYSFQIVYSAFDKAGNESIYISRGVLFLDLVPEINAAVGGEGNELTEVEQNSYSLVVEQGQDAETVAKNLIIDAGRYSDFITQTIYYNGELVVDNKKYNGGIYDGFTTSVPGVYEIIYNANYMYYKNSSDKVGELMEADPVKLTITVESTPPIVEVNTQPQNNHFVMVIGVLMSFVFVAMFGFVIKKKKN